MSVRARYKILRQAKARLVKAMEAALWRRKDWEDSGPDPADSSGRRRLWRWQGAPPAGGKVPRPRTQIRKPGTGRGARTTQETTPMSEQSQNTPIRGQLRLVQGQGFRGGRNGYTLLPEGVRPAQAWQRTDDPRLFAELALRPAVQKQLRGEASCRVLNTVITAMLQNAGPLAARAVSAWRQMYQPAALESPSVQKQRGWQVRELAIQALSQSDLPDTLVAPLTLIHMMADGQRPQRVVASILQMRAGWQDDPLMMATMAAIRKELPNPFARKPAMQQVDPVAYRNREARQSVEAALDDDIANGDARRVLADLEEEEGREGLAAVHRQLIDLQPYGPLTEQDRQAIRQAFLNYVEQDDEDDPVRITENYDPQLRVWYFQVDRESGRDGDPVRFLVNQKRGAVDYDRLRNLADR